ncbi:capping complex subunit for YIEGIA [Aneurinibacillus aneurinilyticus]|jgi:hypothetical protein|uniref:capping complex subunit for YIEGIA n=1 Tax=Aneurinibacillus aneurinilyticus TaxID=1391 RepID=UPI0023F440D5|nr:hypothetical protein [Aneurinibacillus aneurinilyticus]MCI1692989.1 hypothetical protein [Aneurinibacillus aneurinilyticus]
MGISIQQYILAVITKNRSRIGGSPPIFYAEGEQELQQIAFTLEKILDGVVHEITPDTLIIVKHS